MLARLEIETCMIIACNQAQAGEGRALERRGID